MVLSTAHPGLRCASPWAIIFGPFGATIPWFTSFDGLVANPNSRTGSACAAVPGLPWAFESGRRFALEMHERRPVAPQLFCHVSPLLDKPAVRNFRIAEGRLSSQP